MEKKIKIEGLPNNYSIREVNNGYDKPFYRLYKDGEEVNSSFRLNQIEAAALAMVEQEAEAKEGEEEEEEREEAAQEAAEEITAPRTWKEYREMENEFLSIVTPCEETRPTPELCKTCKGRGNCLCRALCAVDVKTLI